MTDRETDSFIQEVTEEVRQDRMFALWKKWGPFVIGAIILIVAGAAYWSWTDAQTRAAAEARGGTFLAADPDTSADQVALPGQVDGPAQIVAEFAAAGALAADRQVDQALTAYRAIAARPDLALEYADLALLRAAQLAADVEALAPLAQADRPYRLLALELRAALLLEAGDVEAAHADLRAIILDPLATPGSRGRAQAVLQATGGDVADAAG